jgi:FemAB-related protein (PEP-CTERM system-associated)
VNAPFTQLGETIALADLRDRHEVARIEGFVREHRGTLFQRPVWLLAAERGAGQRARGLIAEKGGQLVGWLPLSEVHSPLFGRALVSSGFGVGGGVLAAREGTAHALARAAAELAVRLSCAEVELRGGPAPADWTVTEDSHANFSAPLAETDEAQLLSVPRRQRAEIRKGLARDFVLTVGNGSEDLAIHHAIYAESVRNLGTPVFPRSLFGAMLDAFGEDADILTLRLDGQPIASVLNFYHDGAVMPYWGGGLWAARAARANERIHFEVMRHARARGCTRFDFGRSKTGSGAYSYKKNWGFTPEPFAYSRWTAPGQTPRDINPNSEAYSARVALWKRMPLPVANRLGPVIARGLA